MQPPGETDPSQDKKTTYGPVDDRTKPPTKPKFSDAAFREAARQGDATLVRQALESGNNANAADQDGRTALQLASFDGHAEVVKLLLDQKANVNHCDGAGRTALMYAATGANSATVTMLLEAGAETDVTDTAEGFTALMFAAAEGQREVVQILLLNNADASITDKDGDRCCDAEHSPLQSVSHHRRRITTTEIRDRFLFHADDRIDHRQGKSARNHGAEGGTEDSHQHAARNQSRKQSEDKTQHHPRNYNEYVLVGEPIRS